MTENNDKPMKKDDRNNKKFSKSSKVRSRKETKHKDNDKTDDKTVDVKSKIKVISDQENVRLSETKKTHKEDDSSVKTIERKVKVRKLDGEKTPVNDDEDLGSFLDDDVNDSDLKDDGKCFYTRDAILTTILSAIFAAMLIFVFFFERRRFEGRIES